MSKYAEIIERLEKATGPDRELDRDVHVATNKPLRKGFQFGHIPSYTASIDAALALVKRMLPDARMTVLESYDLTWRFVISMPDPLRGAFQSEGKSRNAPIAILLALFRALEAKETAG